MENKSLFLRINLLLFLLPLSSYAAKPIDLSHQPTEILQHFISHSNISSNNRIKQNDIKEISREQDAKGTMHIRIKQFYQGIPVFQGNAVLHVPTNNSALSLSSIISNRMNANITMNGIFYQHLDRDLTLITPNTYSDSAKANVLKHAIKLFHATHSVSSSIQDQKIESIIFTDKQHKAHPAYLVNFVVQEQHTRRQKPTFIIDAITQTVYQSWDDIKTLTAVKGGGIGGNEGIVGKLFYDGLKNNFPALSFERNGRTKFCFLQNNQLQVIDQRDGKTPKFKCLKPDKEHNNIYWNTNNDYANGGYSPNTDAIYSDYIVRKMYLDWFNVIMLKQYPEKPDDSTPWKIKMITHDPNEGQNAWWDNGTMAFGEGDNESYPVVAPSVVAHELSHGFTQQQSKLVYHGESGGLNESFSDMADKAIEYYVYGKNTWTIDPELLKSGGRLLRYLDDPTKDCAPGKKPGDGCSIARYRDYHELLGVHYSSGIFNHAFYLLANKWNTKKAFEIMVYANRFYWTPTTTFKEAACGIAAATKYYQYDLNALQEAMKAVDLDISNCKI